MTDMLDGSRRSYLAQLPGVEISEIASLTSSANQFLHIRTSENSNFPTAVTSDEPDGFDNGSYSSSCAVGHHNSHRIQQCKPWDQLNGHPSAASTAEVAQRQNGGRLGLTIVSTSMAGHLQSWTPTWSVDRHLQRIILRLRSLETIESGHHSASFALDECWIDHCRLSIHLVLYAASKQRIASQGRNTGYVLEREGYRAT